MRTLSHAETNTAIRAALKDAFPQTRFSVRKSSGTGYTRVSWMNGPTPASVQRLCSGFTSERYDSLEECTQPTGHTLTLRGEQVRPFCSGVHTDRGLTYEAVSWAMKRLGVRDLMEVLPMFTTYRAAGFEANFYTGDFPALRGQNAVMGWLRQVDLTGLDLT